MKIEIEIPDNYIPELTEYAKYLDVNLQDAVVNATIDFLLERYDAK